MERHLSTGVSTIVALMAAHRATLGGRTQTPPHASRPAQGRPPVTASLPPFVSKPAPASHPRSATPKRVIETTSARLEQPGR